MMLGKTALRHSHIESCWEPTISKYPYKTGHNICGTFPMIIRGMSPVSLLVRPEACAEVLGWSYKPWDNISECLR